MKTTIGIDIGTEDVKAISLEGDSGAYKLTGYGYLEYRGDNEKLKNFIKNGSLGSGDIRVNIEDPSLKVRRLDLPVMPEAEIQESVKWGLKDIVEGDVEDFDFRYTKIDSGDLEVKGKIPLVVFAIKKEAVEHLYKFLTEVGLKNPKIIEPNVGALSSMISFIRGREFEGYDVAIDLGSNASLFTVVGKSGVLYSRPLSGSADSNLVDQIARDIGVNINDAEGAKLAYFGDEKKSSKLGKKVELKEETRTILGNTISHFFTRLSLEIQRSIDGFLLLFERRKINKVYLCGGGAYYKGLAGYLGETLGIKISVFDPFEKMDMSRYGLTQIEQLKKSGALYAVACGLAVD